MSTHSIVVKVNKKVTEAPDIVSFELVSTDGSPLPSFSAGAHIDVQVTETITRQYSLCNDPREAHRYLIGVLRDANSRGGSAAMHDHVREGDQLRISAPKNHFPLAHAEKSLLFAGGIGVTPILCMAERLAQLGADFEMHYCTRSRERTAFFDRIKGASFADRVQFHFDDGPGEQKLKALEILAAAGTGKHLYACGPAGFIEHVVDTAKCLNWSSEQVHLEYFGAAPIETADDTAFDVQIASTGKRYNIPKNQTVVEVLKANGIDIPLSCEQGVCGTCITRVLSGTPDHRDMYFTDEEHAKNDQFTPCCSRAKTKTLTLDL